MEDYPHLEAAAKPRAGKEVLNRAIAYLQTLSYRFNYASGVLLNGARGYVLKDVSSKKSL